MIIRIIFVFFFLMIASHNAQSELSDTGGLEFDRIIDHIEELENVSDPKCYATASRLEDFIYGTPLSADARFAKNILQKEWLTEIWRHASVLAKSATTEEVREQDVVQVLKPVIAWQQSEQGHWDVSLAGKYTLKIHRDDKRQYSSIAYSLRSMLAVQQEALMLNADDLLLPLSIKATDKMVEALDFYILSVLQIADKEARMSNQYEVEESVLVSTWSAMQGMAIPAFEPDAGQSRDIQSLEPIEPILLNKMIEQKLRSYMQYNDISNQLFVRNLQVFFAKNRWPEKSEEARRFRQDFTERMIEFTAELYQGAQTLAMQHGHHVIHESDIHQFAQSILPHNINEYEDAIFFPRLSGDEQVTIEAYDMDAFRDGGIHWLYLQFALGDKKFPIYLEPDPFAAELLVENVAQFGVLILRLTGDMGRATNMERIELSHFQEANAELRRRVGKNQKAAAVVNPEEVIASAPGVLVMDKDETFFTDVTSLSGVDYMHRSSDWLSRLLRSYLRKDANTGTITIPPAFGGSGVAVGDINNDGHDDLLLLGGRGNRLYLNDGTGKFSDISESSGLAAWVRTENKQPGESRQPLIADLDNDGWQDIVITYVDDTHRVYRNNGDNTFLDVTDLSQLGGKGLVGGPATVFDFDNDGLLDIYITYFGNYLKGVLPTLRRVNVNGLPNKLFKNMGGFKFKDVTAGSGVDNTGWGQAVTHTDFDGDGLQDLISGNDFGINAYYKNLGGGKFKDVASILGTDKPSYTMGIGLADLNSDTIADIYIANIVTMNKDEKYVLPSADTAMKFNPDKLANMRVVEANDLFVSSRRENEKLRYERSSKVGRGYSTTGWSWGSDFLDFDNDGDDDLYVLNGMNDYHVYGRENPYYTDPEGEQADVLFADSKKDSNVFFLNENGLLNNASKESGIDFMSNARSAAYFDMDSDGDLDMVINNYHEAANVIKNNSERLKHNWLKVKLIGAPEEGVNLDAIGAKIIVTTGDGIERMREISGSVGYMSVHSKVRHFGLMQHQKADVKVIWPNGDASELKGVGVNKIITIDFADIMANKGI